MRNICILGSTGTIGTQTLDVVRLNNQEMRVTGLSCKNNINKLEKQIREFNPKVVAVFDEKAAEDLKVRVADLDVKVMAGMQGLIDLAPESGADIMFSGIVGMIGILPTISAINCGMDIALANKETSVTAGHIIKPLAQKKNVAILPVDSEHSAIFQALQGRGDSNISRIILTASGGPFYTLPAEEVSKVTVTQALAHPTWSMGPKITIDSATMVNKGLEIIEAAWFFNVPADKIEVLVQRESQIHSAVEFEDGSIIAQMGPSDMRIPIQYALTYPNHLPSPAKPLDLTKLVKLTFGQPRNDVFKGIPLAYRAMESSGSMLTVYNAANEWANQAFRDGIIGFTDIYHVIEKAMDTHDLIKDPTVEEILAIENDINLAFNAEYGCRVL